MAMESIPQLLIGAVSSGSGKTTLSLGLMRLLHRRGLRVQPYKCGPDYIDTQFHRVAAGRPSVNLDLFFAGGPRLRNTYSHWAQGADAVVVEGAMGLFDGAVRAEGSAAQVAQVLGLPVIVVLNAEAMAYTAAPLLYGLKHFAEGLEVVGVVFNQVKTKSHYQFLQDAAADVGLCALGYLPPAPALGIPSRHLGLNTDTLAQQTQYAEQVADFVEQHIDVAQLLYITKRSRPIEPSSKLYAPSGRNLKIALAHDEAFNFMYEENLELLKTLGEVVFFSPLRAQALPPCDLLYLPGGYPELHLEALSGNTKMLTAVRRWVETGGRTWGECGGMMYLSTSIESQEGHVYPMVGVLPQLCSMRQPKLKLGYRQFCYHGLQLRGHEFHYSHSTTALPSEAQVYSARGQAVDAQLLRYKNTLASYVHLYWPSAEALLRLFEQEEL